RMRRPGNPAYVVVIERPLFRRPEQYGLIDDVIFEPLAVDRVRRRDGPGPARPWIGREMQLSSHDDFGRIDVAQKTGHRREGTLRRREGKRLVDRRSRNVDREEQSLAG